MVPLREYLRRYHVLATERDQLMLALEWARGQNLGHVVDVLMGRLARVEAELTGLEKIQVTTNEPVYDRT